jgi:hypothetical protein
MLDLEVVPERSLGNEQWEFVLGKFSTPEFCALLNVNICNDGIVIYLNISQILFTKYNRDKVRKNSIKISSMN